eukprot:CAMPEP_0114631534 /NCGR_PEP_ID=MMETSP0168-20121206/14462_1 /TAXON_ID=95228 ORGANISM="Vannella sp., Strain DIVA3 517/6/12" /NCGR_SAMPLE_ID=MMETSP0168 /ASSEMBLY_ACC=CAM_ASM_000044 /LENGTH=366 /DNA_ID=CAMNT_0001843103 /DNA_START=401 /DNA_END=1501 /DNA_ORIENTATION=+
MKEALVDQLGWDVVSTAAAVMGDAGLPMGPSHRLVVTQQSSFEKEEFSANGSHQVLHYVLKNKVYTMDVALERSAAGGEDLFFSDRGVDLSASLFYDSSDRKEVAAHMTRPLSYKGMRSGAADAVESFEPTHVMRVEFSIAVLSSHHNASNFVVRFQAIDCATGAELPGIVPAYSQPISVISKPDVLQKKRLKEAGKLQADKVTGAQRKRAPPKTQAMLTDLQATTNAILAQVQLLAATRQEPAAGSRQPLCGKKRSASERENPEDAFSHHLRAAVEAFGHIAGGDRPQKVRRTVASLRAEDADRLAELADAVRCAVRAPLTSSSNRLNLDNFGAPSSSHSTTSSRLNLDDRFEDLLNMADFTGFQ